MLKYDINMSGGRTFKHGNPARSLESHHVRIMAEIAIRYP
jgi:hypothetical protein